MIHTLKTLFFRASSKNYIIPGSLVGTFAFEADRLFGEVTDETEAKTNIISVYIRRGGKNIHWSETERVGETFSYRFTTRTGNLLEASELLSAKVEVLARSELGQSGTLRLDGAAGLELVRQYLGVPVEVLCDISFARTGNSAAFTGTGWSGVEEQSTWTEDNDSILRLPTIETAGAYGLRLTSGAMVSAPLCNGQNVEIYLNGVFIWGQYVAFSHPQFFEVNFDGGPFLSQPLELRLHHPDAFRLQDSFPDGDPRRLSLSVRRLVLVRFK